MRRAVGWVTDALGLTLALLATLGALYIVFLLLTARPHLFSDAASSVSGAPGP